MKSFKIRLTTFLNGIMHDDFVGEMCVNIYTHKLRGYSSDGEILGFYNEETRQLNLVRLKDNGYPRLYIFDDINSQGKSYIYNHGESNWILLNEKYTTDVKVEISPINDAIADDSILHYFIEKINQASLDDLYILNQTMLVNKIYRV